MLSYENIKSRVLISKVELVQFYSRALFVESSIKTYEASHLANEFAIDRHMSAMKAAVMGIEAAKAHPSKSSHYSFLVYNGSVFHWHAARPLFRSGRYKYTVNSLKYVVVSLQQLATAEEPDIVEWALLNISMLLHGLDSINDIQGAQDYLSKTTELVKKLPEGSQYDWRQRLRSIAAHLVRHEDLGLSISNDNFTSSSKPLKDIVDENDPQKRRRSEHLAKLQAVVSQFNVLETRHMETYTTRHLGFNIKDAELAASVASNFDNKILGESKTADPKGGSKGKQQAKPPASAGDDSTILEGQSGRVYSSFHDVPGSREIENLCISALNEYDFMASYTYLSQIKPKKAEEMWNKAVNDLRGRGSTPSDSSSSKKGSARTKTSAKSKDKEPPVTKQSAGEISTSEAEKILFDKEDPEITLMCATAAVRCRLFVLASVCIDRVVASKSSSLRHRTLADILSAQVMYKLDTVDNECSEDDVASTDSNCPIPTVSGINLLNQTQKRQQNRRAAFRVLDRALSGAARLGEGDVMEYACCTAWNFVVEHLFHPTASLRCLQKGKVHTTDDSRTVLRILQLICDGLESLNSNMLILRARAHLERALVLVHCDMLADSAEQISKAFALDYSDADTGNCIALMTQETLLHVAATLSTPPSFETPPKQRPDSAKAKKKDSDKGASKKEEKNEASTQEFSEDAIKFLSVIMQHVDGRNKRREQTVEQEGSGETHKQTTLEYTPENSLLERCQRLCKDNAELDIVDVFSRQRLHMHDTLGFYSGLVGPIGRAGTSTECNAGRQFDRALLPLAKILQLTTNVDQDPETLYEHALFSLEQAKQSKSVEGALSQVRKAEDSLVACTRHFVNLINQQVEHDSAVKQYVTLLNDKMASYYDFTNYGTPKESAAMGDSQLEEVADSDALHSSVLNAVAHEEIDGSELGASFRRLMESWGSLCLLSSQLCATAIACRSFNICHVAKWNLSSEKDLLRSQAEVDIATAESLSCHFLGKISILLAGSRKMCPRDIYIPPSLKKRVESTYTSQSDSLCVKSASIWNAVRKVRRKKRDIFLTLIKSDPSNGPGVKPTSVCSDSCFLYSSASADEDTIEDTASYLFDGLDSWFDSNGNLTPEMAIEFNDLDKVSELEQSLDPDDGDDSQLRELCLLVTTGNGRDRLTWRRISLSQALCLGIDVPGCPPHLRCLKVDILVSLVSAMRTALAIGAPSLVEKAASLLFELHRPALGASVNFPGSEYFYHVPSFGATCASGNNILDGLRRAVNTAVECLLRVGSQNTSLLTELAVASSHISESCGHEKLLREDSVGALGDFNTMLAVPTLVLLGSLGGQLPARRILGKLKESNFETNNSVLTITNSSDRSQSLEEYLGLTSIALDSILDISSNSALSIPTLDPSQTMQLLRVCSRARLHSGFTVSQRQQAFASIRRVFGATELPSQEASTTKDKKGTSPRSQEKILHIVDVATRCVNVGADSLQQTPWNLSTEQLYTEGCDGGAPALNRLIGLLECLNYVGVSSNEDIWHQNGIFTTSNDMDMEKVLARILPSFKDIYCPLLLDGSWALSTRSVAATYLTFCPSTEYVGMDPENSRPAWLPDSGSKNVALLQHSPIGLKAHTIDSIIKYLWNILPLALDEVGASSILLAYKNTDEDISASSNVSVLRYRSLTFKAIMMALDPRNELSRAFENLEADVVKTSGEKSDGGKKGKPPVKPSGPTMDLPDALKQLAYDVLARALLDCPFMGSGRSFTMTSDASHVLSYIDEATLEAAEKLFANFQQDKGVDSSKDCTVEILQCFVLQLLKRGNGGSSFVSLVSDYFASASLTSLNIITRISKASRFCWNMQICKQVCNLADSFKGLVHGHQGIPLFSSSQQNTIRAYIAECERANSHALIGMLSDLQGPEDSGGSLSQSDKHSLYRGALDKLASAAMHSSSAQMLHLTVNILSDAWSVASPLFDREGTRIVLLKPLEALNDAAIAVKRTVLKSDSPCRSHMVPLEPHKRFEDECYAGNRLNGLICDFSKMILTIYSDMQNWKPGLSAANTLFDQLPGAFHNILWPVRIKLQAHAGEDTSHAMAMLKSSSDTDDAALGWMTLANSRKRTSDQLDAFDNALTELEGTFAQRIVLTEYSDWLLRNRFSLDDVRSAIHSAIDILLSVLDRNLEDDEDEAAEDGLDKKSMDDATSHASSRASSKLGSRKSGCESHHSISKGSSRDNTSPPQTKDRTRSANSGTSSASSVSNDGHSDFPENLNVEHYLELIDLFARLSRLASTGVEQVRYGVLSVHYILQMWKVHTNTCNSVAALEAFRRNGTQFKSTVQSCTGGYMQWEKRRLDLGIPFENLKEPADWCAAAAGFGMFPWFGFGTAEAEAERCANSILNGHNVSPEKDKVAQHSSIATNWNEAAANNDLFNGMACKLFSLISSVKFADRIRKPKLRKFLLTSATVRKPVLLLDNLQSLSKILLNADLVSHASVASVLSLVISDHFMPHPTAASAPKPFSGNECKAEEKRIQNLFDGTLKRCLEDSLTSEKLISVLQDKSPSTLEAVVCSVCLLMCSVRPPCGVASVMIQTRLHITQLLEVMNKGDAVKSIRRSLGLFSNRTIKRILVESSGESSENNLLDGPSKEEIAAYEGDVRLQHEQNQNRTPVTNTEESSSSRNATLELLPVTCPFASSDGNITPRHVWFAIGMALIADGSVSTGLRWIQQSQRHAEAYEDSVLQRKIALLYCFLKLYQGNTIQAKHVVKQILASLDSAFETSRSDGISLCSILSQISFVASNLDDFTRSAIELVLNTERSILSPAVDVDCEQNDPITPKTESAPHLRAPLLNSLSTMSEKQLNAICSLMDSTTKFSDVLFLPEVMIEGMTLPGYSIPKGYRLGKMPSSSTDENSQSVYGGDMPAQTIIDNIRSHWLLTVTLATRLNDTMDALTLCDSAIMHAARSFAFAEAFDLPRYQVESSIVLATVLMWKAQYLSGCGEKFRGKLTTLGSWSDNPEQPSFANVVAQQWYAHPLQCPEQNENLDLSLKIANDAAKFLETVQTRVCEIWERSCRAHLPSTGVHKTLDNLGCVSSTLNMYILTLAGRLSEIALFIEARKSLLQQFQFLSKVGMDDHLGIYDYTTQETARFVRTNKLAVSQLFIPNCSHEYTASLQRIAGRLEAAQCDSYTEGSPFLVVQRLLCLGIAFQSAYASINPAFPSNDSLVTVEPFQNEYEPFTSSLQEYLWWNRDVVCQDGDLVAPVHLDATTCLSKPSEHRIATLVCPPLGKVADESSQSGTTESKQLKPPSSSKGKKEKKDDKKGSASAGEFPSAEIWQAISGCCADIVEKKELNNVLSNWGIDYRFEVDDSRSAVLNLPLLSLSCLKRENILVNSGLAILGITLESADQPSFGGITRMDKFSELVKLAGTFDSNEPTEVSGKQKKSSAKGDKGSNKKTELQEETEFDISRLSTLPLIYEKRENLIADMTSYLNTKKCGSVLPYELCTIFNSPLLLTDEVSKGFICLPDFHRNPMELNDFVLRITEGNGDAPGLKSVNTTIPRRLVNEHLMAQVSLQTALWTSVSICDWVSAGESALRLGETTATICPGRTFMSLAMYQSTRVRQKLIALLLKVAQYSNPLSEGESSSEGEAEFDYGTPSFALELQHLCQQQFSIGMQLGFTMAENAELKLLSHCVSSIASQPTEHSQSSLPHDGQNSFAASTSCITESAECVGYGSNKNFPSTWTNCQSQLNCLLAYQLLDCSRPSLDVARKIPHDHLVLLIQQHHLSEFIYVSLAWKEDQTPLDLKRSQSEEFQFESNIGSDIPGIGSIVRKVRWAPEAFGEMHLLIREFENLTKSSARLISQFEQNVGDSMKSASDASKICGFPKRTLSETLSQEQSTADSSEETVVEQLKKQGFDLPSCTVIDDNTGQMESCVRAEDKVESRLQTLLGRLERLMEPLFSGTCGSIGEMLEHTDSPVLLLLDPELAELPLEGLPQLKKHPVTRDLSLQFYSNRLALAHSVTDNDCLAHPKAWLKAASVTEAASCSIFSEKLPNSGSPEPRVSPIVAAESLSSIRRFPSHLPCTEALLWSLTGMSIPPTPESTSINDSLQSWKAHRYSVAFQNKKALDYLVSDVAPADASSVVFIVDPKKEQHADNFETENTLAGKDDMRFIMCGTFKREFLNDSSWAGYSGDSTMPTELQWIRAFTGELSSSAAVKGDKTGSQQDSGDVVSFSKWDGGLVSLLPGHIFSNVAPRSFLGLDCRRCRFAVLGDLCSSGKCEKRLARLRNMQPPEVTEFERPWETAALLSLCGVNTIVKHRWSLRAQQGYSWFTDFWKRLTSHDDHASISLSEAAFAASSRGIQMPGKRVCLKDRICLNPVVYGLPQLSLSNLEHAQDKAPQKKGKGPKK